MRRSTIGFGASHWSYTNCQSILLKDSCLSVKCIPLISKYTVVIKKNIWKAREKEIQVMNLLIFKQIQFILQRVLINCCNNN